MRPLIALLVVAACTPPQMLSPDAGDAGDAGPERDAGSDAGRDAGAPDAGPVPSNRARDIVTTALDVELMGLTATATLSVAPSALPGASFEAAGLGITGVTLGDGGEVAWSRDDAGWLDVAVGPAADAITVRYTLTGDRPFPQGLLSSGSTLSWPVYCGNLFPCHSNPADGVRFTLNVRGNPSGTSVVYTPDTYSEAPAYQVGWATGSHHVIELGYTDAGTKVTVWQRSSSTLDPGSRRLRDIVEFYERTYGPYPFGPRIGSVEVQWPAAVGGGMEHHPFWHVQAGTGTEAVQAHEAAHGWFGDGVRIACWEDLMLSEGAADYLSARAIAFVNDGGTAQWSFPSPGAQGSVVWPDSCGAVDPWVHRTAGVYTWGAWFLAALEARLGTPAMDASLRRFFLQRRGQAAGIQQLLDAVEDETGYDAKPCALAWLRSGSVPASPARCP